MTTRLNIILARSAVALAVVVIVGYGLFEARRLVGGPEIVLTQPQDGSTVSGPVVHIQGTVQNAAFITIDSERAYADEQGNFSKTISPPAGFAALTISATDRFGRTQTRTVRIIVVDYCPARA